MTQDVSLLASLDGRRLGANTLRLVDVRPGAKSGWLAFRLRLASGNAWYEPAVLEGIFSAGGRGVAPWIEITDYQPRVRSAGPDAAEHDLARHGLERQLFGYLGELISPGGHLMLACEGPAHETTYRLLMRRVPPPVTPLGRLLFDVGFRSVRFFYLAEGGWEGQQKLWAEKALTPETLRRWDETVAREILQFLAEAENARFAGDCAEATLHVLRSIAPPGELGELVRAVVERCGQAAQEPSAFFDCARRLITARTNATA